MSRYKRLYLGNTMLEMGQNLGANVLNQLLVGESGASVSATRQHLERHLAACRQWRCGETPLPQQCEAV
jgi:hypothetical protein